MLFRSRKAAAAKQREVERKYYKPDTPRYKRLRLIWWILLIAAIGCTTLSFVGQQSLPPQVAVVTLILAYVFIIAAFVLDFWKIKKERVAYQERMLALEEKNAKAEKQARRVQQAKQVKAKGSGKNQNRHAAQKKAGEADGDADAADAGESDEPPVKPARRGLFGSGFRLSNREKMQAEKKMCIRDRSSCGSPNVVPESGAAYTRQRLSKMSASVQMTPAALARTS